MKKFLLLATATILSSCGTTSSLREEGAASNMNNLNFSEYNKVIVKDFKNEVPNASNNSLVEADGKKFAIMIVDKIKEKDAFDEVLHNGQAPGKALLIQGAITEYEPGNAGLRAMVGFGAGSSNFDADINILDNKSKKKLASMNADKTSWALGGAIAAGQNIGVHMLDVAQKIADEVTEAKTK
jgi:hypothetical protein